MIKKYKLLVIYVWYNIFNLYEGDYYERLDFLSRK